MLVGKARSLPQSGAPEMARVGSWPCYHILDKTGRATRGKHSNLFDPFIRYEEKGFITLAPGASVLKLLCAK